MDLSLGIIEICNKKFGKGEFYGFEFDDKRKLENISKEEVRIGFDKLLENELVTVSKEGVNFTALAYNIFNIMTNPEQAVIITNHASGIITRIYFRNTYYLYVCENTKDESCRIELLPTLDLVVGALVNALYLKDYPPEEAGKTEKDFQIEAKSWNKERTNASQLNVAGKYLPENVFYQVIYTEKGISKTLMQKDDISNLINGIMTWLLHFVSEQYKSEG